VSCRVTQAFTPKAGSKQNTTVTRVMRLRRQDAAWVIDGVRTVTSSPSIPDHLHYRSFLWRRIVDAP
jgi:hypothetical protein